MQSSRAGARHQSIMALMRLGRASLALLLANALHPAFSVPAGWYNDEAAEHPCAACAAVANELERQMHEEWAHLQLTVRDRKRRLAADAVKEHACGEAIQQILTNICDAVKDYAPGRDGHGEVYYQKAQGLSTGESIKVTGTLTIGGPKRSDLKAYCESLMQVHEPSLAAVMADGTDDLLNDLCVKTASQCNAESLAKLPTMGMPRRSATRGSLRTLLPW